MKRRAYRNENIYRIIGGMHCLRLEDGSFICGSASAIKNQKAENATAQEQSA